MQFKVKPRNQISPFDWNRVVKNSPDGWVFGLHEWQEMICEVTDWNLEDLSFGCYLNNELIAIVPLQIDKNSYRAGSSGWGVCGPMLRCQPDEKSRKRLFLSILKETEKKAVASGAISLQMGSSPTSSSSIEQPRGVNPYIEAAYEDSSRVTKIINLSSNVESLWSDLSKTARQMIKRANKQGYRAELRDWKEEVESYYSIHVENYNRTGVKPHPKSYFEGIARYMAPSESSILWVGLLNDEPVAYKNIAVSEQSAYFHTGCCRTKHLDSGINYLLMWQVILQMKDAGKELFEIGDVFPWIKTGKLQGLTFYKTRFGGELYQKFLGEKMLQDTKAKEESNQPSEKILVAPEKDRQDCSLVLIMSYRGNLKELNSEKLSFWGKLEPNEFRQHRASHRDFYANPRNWEYQIKALKEKVWGTAQSKNDTILFDKLIFDRDQVKENSSIKKDDVVNLDHANCWQQGEMGKINEYKRVILVYSDALGLGCEKIEGQLRKRAKLLYILNGRKRFFQLTNFLTAKIYLSRVLAKSRVIEKIFALGFIILATYFFMLSKIREK